MNTTEFNKFSLFQSPFSKLDISIFDDKRQIIKQCNENLSLDEKMVLDFKNILTTSRRRLTAELAWLPGIPPTQAFFLIKSPHHLLNILKNSHNNFIPITRANLLGLVFESSCAGEDLASICNCILDLSYTVDRINSEQTCLQINEDRQKSGFSPVDYTWVEEDIAKRRAYYKQVVANELSKITGSTLLAALVRLIKESTSKDKGIIPSLVHELIDHYEQANTKKYFLPQLEKIKNLIAAILEKAPRGEGDIIKIVDELEHTLKVWTAYAKPIQLSLEAQGLNHDLSHDAFHSVRDLAVSLFNNYSMLDLSKRLINSLHGLFSNVSFAVEKISQDISELNDIANKRAESLQRQANWESEITYEAKLGLIFKDDLKISPDGVMLKSKWFPLESIANVRWGATQKYVNGIPTGIEYLIGVGDRRVESVIEFKKSDVYNNFLDCLWKAVCVRLMTEYAQMLRDGQTLAIGTAKFTDIGVTLFKKKLLGFNTSFFEWNVVSFKSYNGSLLIFSEKDTSFFVDLSYRDIFNTHILEAILKLSFKKWTGKLSGILD